LVQTVRAAGYNCGKAAVTFGITELHYAPSVAPLEQELARVPGVLKVAANQATETVTVEYVRGVTTAEALERPVEAPGSGVAAPVCMLVRAWVKVRLAVLTLPVVAWSGRQFYRGAWSGFRHRTADMNTLIGVGTGAAYLYSLVATFVPGLFTRAGLPADVYYEAVAAIIALILLGRLLEARAKGRTSE